MAMFCEKKKILSYIAKIESSVVFIVWKVKHQPRGTTPTPSAPPKRSHSRKEVKNCHHQKLKQLPKKELHAIADEAIGNAKKIYIHYTPLEGAMVIRLLF